MTVRNKIKPDQVQDNKQRVRAVYDDRTRSAHRNSYRREQQLKLTIFAATGGVGRQLLEQASPPATTSQRSHGTRAS
jgi:hypothetical protein